MTITPGFHPPPLAAADRRHARAELPLGPRSGHPNSVNTGSGATTAGRPAMVPRVAQLAREARPKKILHDLGWVGGGTLVGHVLGTLSSVLLRTLLEPSLMGVWSGLKLLLSYSNYAGLGVSKAAAREIAIQSGVGNAQAVHKAANVAFTFNTITSFVYMLGLLIVAAWIAAYGRGPLTHDWSVGLMVVGLCVMLQRYATFGVTVLRARQRFDLTAKLNMFEAVTSLLTIAVGVWLFGIYGLFGSSFLVLLGSIVFLRGCGAAGFRLHWDGRKLRALLADGFPILAGGALLSLLQSLDRLMIMGYLPDRELQLGYYSLALMVTGPLTGLGNMVGMVMYPRYQSSLGRTGSPLAVARLAASVTLALALGMGGILALAALAGPPLLGWLFPAYAPGIPAMVALLPGTLFLTLSLPANHYLVTINEQHRTVVVTIVALLVTAMAQQLVLTSGGGITAVAWVTSAGSLIYFLLLAITCARAIRPLRGGLGLNDLGLPHFRSRQNQEDAGDDLGAA